MQTRQTSGRYRNPRYSRNYRAAIDDIVQLRSNSLHFKHIRRKSRHSVKMSTLTRTFRNLWRIGFKVGLSMPVWFVAIGHANILFSRNMDIKCRYVSAKQWPWFRERRYEAHVRLFGEIVYR
jgi:hypothetical protein